MAVNGRSVIREDPVEILAAQGFGHSGDEGIRTRDALLARQATSGTSVSGASRSALFCMALRHGASRPLPLSLARWDSQRIASDVSRQRRG